ncbi:hypothetical protein IEE84_04460 [Psychrobacter sp. 28M-43]|uniref:hypothetical protein n=1 Tax=Psychrobacter sp. 28M-43 TaxID=2772254 RepID=UPI00168D4BEC|nr:hypothetical protein [Psychrobacter sp. 28M-43]QOD13538.1 hypothetical protein IEE84_04460 [Psychrobacter sp. 28M-43]
MAELLTIQDSIDGRLDVKSLGEAANGDENTQVVTRTGETYPSAKKAIKTMFANGGLPAQPFATKAMMTASTLANGSYAQVTDDTTNNGLYLKAAGAWVKSAYDPLTQANTYTDTAIKSVADSNAAYLKYLNNLEQANKDKPNAAIVILLGQSLNAPRGTAVQTKSSPIAKMPVGGASITQWAYNATNALWVGSYSELETAVDYVSGAGQTPATGIISAMSGGVFSRLYIGNAAIGARTLDVLSDGGAITNLNALLHRLCTLARNDGYNPQVMFYTAHGEADAAASATEQDYYSDGIRYYSTAQLYAAQAMRKPNYRAPIVFTHPPQQNAPTDKEIKAAIKRLASDLPNSIDLGSIYQYPMSSDRVHPTETSYVLRGEKVGKALNSYFEQASIDKALYMTDVTLSGTTFTATFNATVVRDVSLNFGQALNASQAEDGLEWIDNGTQIAIVSNSLVYSGRNITGTLASAPVGTLEQQKLRVAEQATTATYVLGNDVNAGSVIRKAGDGWQSIYTPSYVNYVWATGQTYNKVRGA